MPVYSLGSNGNGQLGIGHTDDVSTPHLVNLPQELHQTTTVAIRAGGNHTLLHNSSSDVYSTGDNSNGRCTFQYAQSTEFQKCALLPTILLATTWEASMFVSRDDGLVYACGTGLKGELGLGASLNTTTSPIPMPNFPPHDTQIVDIAACMGHVIVVLSNGEVWGWGNGQQGQLGGPMEVVWQPRRVNPVPFKAVRAVCGKDFTAVFGDPKDGEVAILGVQKRDRFGLKTDTPKKLCGWKDVQATWGGVYALMEGGSIIAWGRDDHGQLPPKGLPKIVSIAAGSEHVLALTCEGRVLAWGWGEHGNCGEPVDERKDVTGRWNELDFTGEPISIGAGCATSWVITADERG